MNQRLRHAALWAAHRKHQRGRRLWRRELPRVKGWRRANDTFSKCRRHEIFIAVGRPLYEFGANEMLAFRLLRTIEHGDEGYKHSAATRLSFASTQETLRCSLSFPISPARLPSVQLVKADSKRGASPRPGSDRLSESATLPCGFRIFAGRLPGTDACRLVAGRDVFRNYRYL